MVRASPYAYPFGVPLPLFGLGFYSILALLALIDVHIPSRSASIWLASSLMSGAGVIFSGWLTYLEAYVIHGWCAWCVSQAVAVLVLFIFSVAACVSEFKSRPGSLNQQPIEIRNSWRSRYAILAAAVVIGTPAFVVATRHHDASVPAPSGSGQLIRSDSHWIGNPDAKITIVEFADFQCPACGMAERTNRLIRAQFGDRIRMFLRHCPLEKHSYALGAAKAAECAADQGKFWPMAEMLYDNQSRLSSDQMRQYVAALELDQQKFAACLDDPKTVERIRADIADARALGVNATPTFFINGKRTIGVLDPKQIAAALDDAGAPATGQAGQAEKRMP